MADKNLDGSGLSEVWVRAAQLVKRFTGAVNLTKGDLQTQVDTKITGTAISNSSAITTQGEYALDAREKNASIEGTLANQIDALNSNLQPNTNSLFTYASSDYFEIQYISSVKIGNLIIASFTLHILASMDAWSQHSIAIPNVANIMCAGVGQAVSQNTGYSYTLNGGATGNSIDIRADANPPQKDDWLRGAILFFQS